MKYCDFCQVPSECTRKRRCVKGIIAKEQAEARRSAAAYSPLPWPDSDGWWWCRQPGDGYMWGDEMCVEVTLESRLNRSFVLWRGESYGLDDETFQNMEWIKAQSPWHNAALSRPEQGLVREIGGAFDVVPYVERSISEARAMEVEYTEMDDHEKACFEHGKVIALLDLSHWLSATAEKRSDLSNASGMASATLDSEPRTDL